jgi:predicted amidohydrolase
MNSLTSCLEKATSTLELATELGSVCLGEKETEEIQLQLRDPVADKHRKYLESCVRHLDRTLLLSPGPQGDFTHLLKDEIFEEALQRVEVYPPLEFFAVLKGMLGAVRQLYDNTTGTIDLKVGMPIPIPKRGVNRRLGKATPNSDTSSLLELLWKSGFALYTPRPGARASVQLDFRIARRLDQLTWGAEERLPRIATIHPRLGENGVEYETTADSFFWVRPKDWDPEAVLRQLRRVAGKAEIAVLPELSLPAADALETAISTEPSAFPPLVVAGSAHVAEGEGSTEVRANEARIYLDGDCVARHRKIQPFILRRQLDGTPLSAPLVEDLSRERKTITVLSSDYTRLAVMICSDLISRKLPGQLEDAEVNLLLVPALTPEPGSFNGDICKLASDYQAVCVIANADTALFPGWSPAPFLIMAAVPRPRVKEQSREYRRRWRGCPTAAVIDPNRRLERAVRWV